MSTEQWVAVCDAGKFGLAVITPRRAEAIGLRGTNLRALVWPDDEQLPTCCMEFENLGSLARFVHCMAPRSVKWMKHEAEDQAKVAELHDALMAMANSEAALQ